MSEPTNKIGDALQEAAQATLDRVLGHVSDATREEIAPLLQRMANFAAEGDADSAQVCFARILLVGEYERQVGTEETRELAKDLVAILIKAGVAML